MGGWDGEGDLGGRESGRAWSDGEGPRGEGRNGGTDPAWSPRWKQGRARVGVCRREGDGRGEIGQAVRVIGDELLFQV